MNTSTRTVAAAALACAAAIPHAQAGVLGLGANANAYDVTTTQQAVPLKRDGSRAVTFRTTRADTVVLITYNAECAAAGNVRSYVSIQITVDEVDAAPQIGNDFAFCSPVHTAVLVPNAASRQVVVRVPNAGLHTVRVLATLNSTKSARLDDSSITIRD